MLDFMLCLLLDGHLSDADINLRARRLMLKAITKTPVMPRSLFVTGVKVKVDRDYIASGGFGLVFKGELGGSFVALKVFLVEISSFRLLNLVRIGCLSRSVNVAIPQSQVRITIPRDLRA